MRKPGGPQHFPFAGANTVIWTCVCCGKHCSLPLRLLYAFVPILQGASQAAMRWSGNQQHSPFAGV
jgi:hypothetical protein